MRIRNYLAVSLGNNGLFESTSHDLPAKAALSVYKFKKAVRKAYEEFGASEKELLKNSGIEKDKEPTEEQVKRFNELRFELFNDEVDLGDIAKISFDEYHILAKENKQVKVRREFTDENGDTKTVENIVDVFTLFQEALEGVLWEEEE